MPRDGWTPIRNDILEAIAAADLAGREARLVIAIMRETYGREPYAGARKLASSRLAQITGIGARNVRTIVAALAERRILDVERDGYRTLRIGLNTATDEWQRRPIRPTGGPNRHSAHGRAESTHSARGRADHSAHGRAYIKKEELSISTSIDAVSYTHLTLPTNREV